ncbi:MAG: C39 family peptidase, partial [Clostridia bacterium]|nr:C39 family peptidase [Clostridia bacterium]
GANLMYEYGGSTGSYAYDMSGILQNGTDTYLKDGHGSVIGKYSSGGVSLGAASYDAFGNSIISLNDPFGYCGEYRDSENGLIYLRNRYYDPSIGRFITEDPAKDGMNWYSYCAGNPVNAWDPWGLPYHSMWCGGVSVDGFSIYSFVNYDNIIESNKDERLFSNNPYGIIYNIETKQSRNENNYNVILDVPFIHQTENNLCWAASMAMVITYYTGKNISDVQIAKIVKGEDYNRPAVPSKILQALQNEAFLDESSVKVRSHMMNTSYDGQYGFSSEYELAMFIKSEINMGRPMILNIYGHATVIKGYDYSDSNNMKVILNDPFWEYPNNESEQISDIYGYGKRPEGLIIAFE